MYYYRFRFALRRLKRKVTGDQLAAVEACLANADLCDEACCAVQEMYESQAGGPLTDFLEWVLAHQDEIIALILKLLPLFV